MGINETFTLASTFRISSQKSLKCKVTQTYFLLEEAYIILIHNEAADACSSQVPEIFCRGRREQKKLVKK